MELKNEDQRHIQENETGPPIGLSDIGGVAADGSPVCEYLLWLDRFHKESAKAKIMCGEMCQENACVEMCEAYEALQAKNTRLREALEKRIQESGFIMEKPVCIECQDKRKE